ncbi:MULTISPECIES: hypothetical protein [Arthrobacter]|uniref:Uncharacterized protein n=1 Tax=Arthrobacter terricola TaxID=2547396 RepID=A0A4R5KC00_9MICC|nr:MULTISPECIES: hypothetical protein [Arthrobacter]MBT8163192.1 hypothetical protein [Arthrobacter sp. GN70]TDF91550.1 hypothetical protein E1809_20705 [Arthrobacter terricola]
MSTETPMTKTPDKNRLLLIGGIIVIMLLAIIAWAVASQTITANNKAAAEASASTSVSAQASALAKAADDAQKAIDIQLQEDQENAGSVCVRRVLQAVPDATMQPGKTETTQAADGSWHTVGGWTNPKNTFPMQLECSSTKASGDSWNVFLVKPAAGQ